MSDTSYRPLPVYGSREAVEAVLTRGSKDDLMLLSLSVGEQFPHWRYAQSVCLKLAEHEDPDVRANACTGLAYLARTRSELDKRLVKPVLLRELATQDKNRWRVEEAIATINGYLGWRLAAKQLGTESGSG